MSWPLCNLCPGHSCYLCLGTAQIRGPTGPGASPDQGPHRIRAPSDQGAHRIRGLTESLSGNGQALEITVVVAAAEIDGRPAMRLLKHSGKVLDSGESALCRNIADRQIGMVQ